MARTLISGPIDDVIHYNATSRILADLEIRFLWLPHIVYFDDFAAIIFDRMGQDSLRISTLFCAAFCFRLKPGKSQEGRSVVLWVLLRDFP